MPTKINSAGEQQNYIPKGNGKYSGRYTSSNFGSKAVTEKSKEVLEKLKHGVQTNKWLNDREERAKQSIVNYISNHSNFNKEEREKINFYLDIADSEILGILDNVLKQNYNKYEKGDYPKYLLDERKVILSYNSFRDNGKDFWHENGHLVDSKNIDPNDYFYVNNDILSYGYRSKKYYSTLYEMLSEESKILFDENIRNQILEIQKNYEKQELSDVGINQDQVKQFNEKRHNYENEKQKIINSFNEKYGEILADYYNKDKIKLENEIKNNDYNKEQELKKLNFENDKFLYENNDFILKYNSAILKANKKYQNEYRTLSDLCDAISKSQFNLGAGNHDSKYWQDEINMSSEFFANMFCSKAMKNKEYKIVKKYLPKSVEIFEEIINNIK